MSEAVSSTSDSQNPDDSEQTLMALVARRYYLGRQSKSEIAEQLFLSRFKVARLLTAAQDLSIVRFSISLGGDANRSLAGELTKAFGLKHAVVVDDHEDLVSQFQGVGCAVVELLGEVVQEADLVGISSTRSLMGLGTLTTPIPPARFVQLNGSLSRPDAVDIIDGIRRLTAQARGKANVFYAPMVAASEAAWHNYLGQSDVRVAFSKFSQLSVAVTGLGEWAPGLSLSYDNVATIERDEATDLGAFVEVLGVPVDRAGHTVHCRARQRIVAPDAEVLRAVPLCIGVCVGEPKAEAVKVAIATKLINAVVTHRSLAERLLSL